jgi:hypothetical protein
MQNKILNNIYMETEKEKFLNYPSESRAKKIESLTGLDIDFSPSDQIFDEVKHVEYPQIEITSIGQ